MNQGSVTLRGGRSFTPLTVFLAAACVGCASLTPSPVGPADIPGLQERAMREPGNGDAHLRLGAALAADNRCEEALESVERGRALKPADPVGPLVLGHCLEQAGRYDQALLLYSDFVERNPGAPGVAAVEGRRKLALRQQARETVRAAVRGEETLGAADPETVGVLPFIVDGDPTYEPLSVGLAHMLTTDLALLQRFRLVERVELNALLQELDIPSELIDPATAARTGRLLRASRMVLGTLSVPSDREAQLSGNIVLETGELVEPLLTRGDPRDLFGLEKELAIQTAEGLGYQLTENEIQRIRENQPGSMVAFLAFSRGLMAEDLGDFEGAAAFYSEAARADPGFQEAQQRLRGAVGAGAVEGSTPGEATTVGTEVETSLGALSGTDETATGPTGTSLLASALEGSVIDVASHQAERAMEAGNANSNLDVVPEEPTVPPLVAVILITIIIPR